MPSPCQNASKNSDISDWNETAVANGNPTLGGMTKTTAALLIEKEDVLALRVIQLLVVESIAVQVFKQSLDPDFHIRRR